MKETILKLNYIVDDIHTIIPTKMFTSPNNKIDDDNDYIDTYFALKYKENIIKSKTHCNLEYAIMYLQKSLPNNVSIACCESCMYGNFCPYGDQENEIFCFYGIIVKNKSDVCELFSSEDISKKKRSRELLHFCPNYKPISHDEYYTYNSWGL